MGPTLTGEQVIGRGHGRRYQQVCGRHRRASHYITYPSFKVGQGDVIDLISFDSEFALIVIVHLKLFLRAYASGLSCGHFGIRHLFQEDNSPLTILESNHIGDHLGYAINLAAVNGDDDLALTCCAFEAFFNG